MADDGLPEYPMITRAGTHGLPPPDAPEAYELLCVPLPTSGGGLASDPPRPIRINSTRARPGPADPVAAAIPGTL